MTLNINNREAEQLAHVLARLTGESLTTAVIVALKERLMRLQAKRASPELQTVILKIGHRCAALPNRDMRTPEEILGYDKSGPPS